MSLLLIIAIILFFAGNIIAAVRCIQTNSLPDPLFLVVDSAAVLYVLSGIA